MKLKTKTFKTTPQARISFPRTNHSTEVLFSSFFHLRLKLKLNRLATAAVLHCSNIEVGFANTETSEVQKHRYTSP